MDEIKIIIDGKTCVGHVGDSVLKIAGENGIDIPNLCNSDAVKVYGACGLCTVEISNSPKLMRACSLMATDGMVVRTDGERAARSKKIALELLMSDHEGDCLGPCKLNCPAGTDVQGYLKKIAQGDYHGAVEIIKDKLPLPASIGRVCPHPCEKACRRGKLVEEPLSIAALKAFAADRDLEGDTFRAQRGEASAKRVAVIGGGPAGLTAAYFLSLEGHDVTIYEAMPKAGGMLRYGIPAYRLPKATLDREISEIEAAGVKIICGKKLGTDITLDGLKAENDAVLIAVGAWKSAAMRIVGEELPGVVGGIDFLREVSLYNSKDRKEKPDIGKNVVIAGGGNTAMDACCSAVRLGAENVYVVYRRTRAEMPAEQVEISEAIEEGVNFKFLTNPAEIIAGENGRAATVKLQVMELGEPDASGRRSPVPVEGKFEYIPVDTVIMAIGQKLAPVGLEGIELNRGGNIVADEETFMTSREGIFAVGDATNRGAGIAIAAIGEANKAAEVISSYLRGEIKGCKKPFVSERTPDASEFADREKQARIEIPLRSPEERKKDFEEITLTPEEAKVKAEAGRCLECGCHDYGECKLIKYANKYPINPSRLAGRKNSHAEDRSLVVIERNPGKCILCGLCVRVCEEKAGKGILGLVGRGFSTVVLPKFNNPQIIAGCADCRMCFELCPTGALKLTDKA